MIKLRVLEILAKQNHSKYWLNKQMHLSDKNFNRLVNNETKAIKYENIEKLCTYLNCSPAELFVIIPDDVNYK